MIDPNQLTECLQALMQPNTEIVKQATDYLNNTARNLKGYCSSLLNMTIDENQSIHLRQLAVTTLGQEIKHNYSNVKEAMIQGREQLEVCVNEHRKVFFDGDPVHYNDRKVLNR